MKRFTAAFIVLILILAMPAYAACPAFSSEEYPKVDGSTATLPLSYALMQASTGADENTAMASISHTKTTQSFYALTYGEADLLLVYEPAQEAYDIAKSNGVELLIEPIGLDAPVFLINDHNPVDSLTHEQIVDVYSGKITNWKEVGGNDQPIIAYQRVESSGSQVMMKAQVMKDIPMMDAPTELRPGGMGELVDEIASYRNTSDALGYSVFYYINEMYMQDGVRLLKVNGVMPSNETIASGEYPYRQPFYAVIRADEPEDSPARQLLDWLKTEEGKALIETAGYVAYTGE
ncbi:MAG: substrate-binding domain-containing protein [Clostridia bacterium]|nr:substrate-binding domain-containing protein [Clostridia bacterium]